MRFRTLTAAIVFSFGMIASAQPMQHIRVADDQTHFVRSGSGERFVVWGVNYDHDNAGRLLDEYWDGEWETVVEDFDEIKALGANCVRIHLQLGKFMEAPDKPNVQALERLAKLLELAEQKRLYLDITGLACYHKKNIPAWFDELGERQRWSVQAAFWDAVAKTCANSPAVFCYDLINEPVLPGKEPASEWLLGELGGKYFVQRLSLDLAGRSRDELAKAWVDKMVAAIRRHDDRHMITVGVIPWVFVFGGGKPLFHAPTVGEHLDFVAVHFYPEKGAVDEAIEALKAYEIGKPLIVEEMFPLKCSGDDLARFIEHSSSHADGWISFYWGTPAEQLRAKTNPTIAEAITASWLERFQRMTPRMVGGE